MSRTPAFRWLALVALMTIPALADAQPPVARIHAGDRVRVRTGAAATHVGWVQRLAADTIWLSRCGGSPCTGRPLFVQAGDAIEVSHGYAAVARARHRTVMMATLGGCALGYLAVSGPGKQGYGYIPISAATLLGFLIGAGTAESLHRERWEPVR